MRVFNLLIAVVNFWSPVLSDVTTARNVYSPVFACGGAVTWKCADKDSSSCAKLMDSVAGVAFHPAGRSSVTVVFAAPLVPLVTATPISRVTGLAEIGITASGGETRTENDGTTLISIRLSPL